MMERLIGTNCLGRYLTRTWPDKLLNCGEVGSSHFVLTLQTNY